MSTDSVLDAPTGNRPVKRRNFLPDNSLPEDQNTATGLEHALTPTTTVEPDLAKVEAPTPSGRKSSQALNGKPIDIKPSRRKREPAAKRVPWAFRILPDIIEDWDTYMNTLPRHVSQQDVMEYVLRDFLKRKPKLPDSIIAPPAR